MDPRYCVRIGCGEPVTTIMALAPRECRVWLVDPGESIDHDGIPLCARHADRLTVPFGWEVTDRRRPDPSAVRRKRRRRAPLAAPGEGTPVEATAGEPVEPGETGTGLGVVVELAESTPRRRSTRSRRTRPVPPPPSNPEGDAPAVDAEVPDGTVAEATADGTVAEATADGTVAEAMADGETAGGPELAPPSGESRSGQLLTDTTGELDRGTDDEPTLWTGLPPRMRELDTDDSTPLINRAFRWAHTLE